MIFFVRLEDLDILDDFYAFLKPFYRFGSRIEDFKDTYLQGVLVMLNRWAKAWQVKVR